jgi:DNA-nicking Smr family endonuclease
MRFAVVEVKFSSHCLLRFCLFSQKANNFNYEKSHIHLRELFPNASHQTVRPAPVDRPWSAKSVHHSKVTSTSTQQAERGIITEERVAAEHGFTKRSANVSHLSDEFLDEALGPLLDGRHAAVTSTMSGTQGDSLRNQHTFHAARRAAYFSAAVGAFNRGQHGVAKEMAGKGQSEQHQLYDAQATAVVEIFKLQNLNQERNVYDLHGLQVAESLRLLDFLLRRQRKQGVKEIRVICGVGYHSAGGVAKARLAPAVISYLRAREIPFNQSREGEVKIFLR